MKKAIPYCSTNESESDRSETRKDRQVGGIEADCTLPVTWSFLVHWPTST